MVTAESSAPLAVNLRCNRARIKATQEDVANGVGVTASAIASYENGTSVPSFRVLINLADYYMVSLDSLVGRMNK